MCVGKYTYLFPPGNLERHTADVRKLLVFITSWLNLATSRAPFVMFRERGFDRMHSFARAKLR